MTTAARGPPSSFMPYVTKIECPRCEQELVRKTGGRCPNCGEMITAHVARVRLREKRIEQVIAIVATALVLALFLWGGGFGLIEGIAIYAIAGLGVWYWGKGTFWSDTMRPDDEPGDPEEGKNAD